jgi:hypothetical protein
MSNQTQVNRPSNQITLRVLSQHQIEQLKEMFSKYTIEKVGRVDETGDLFIEYRGGDGWDGVMKSKSIPKKPS